MERQLPSCVNINSRQHRIPQTTTPAMHKRLDSYEQHDDICEFLTCGQPVSPDEGLFAGPFRLKDGLFFSLSSAAVDRGFLRANKVSHIVFINEHIHQPFQASQVIVTARDSLLERPFRSLSIQWQPLRATRDAVWLKNVSSASPRKHFAVRRAMSAFSSVFILYNFSVHRSVLNIFLNCASSTGDC